jgi:hypothetical protein
LMNGCTNRSKWAIDIPSEASAPVSSRRGTASIDRSRDRLGIGHARRRSCLQASCPTSRQPIESASYDARCHWRDPQTASVAVVATSAAHCQTRHPAASLGWR